MNGGKQQTGFVFILISIFLTLEIATRAYGHNHHYNHKALTHSKKKINKKRDAPPGAPPPAVLVVPFKTTIRWIANNPNKNPNNINTKKINYKDKKSIILLKEDECGNIPRRPIYRLRGGGQILRLYHEKQTRKFALITIVSYSILHKLMTLYGPMEFILHSNTAIHILWLLFQFFDIDIVKLEKYFLQPLSWNALRKNPLSVFGSAFSHQDTCHLLGNYSAFCLFAPMALEALGKSDFTHLYLVSILTSSLVGSLWKFCAQSMFEIEHESRFILGASGAISGVMACVCLSQYYGNTLITVGDKNVPLNVYWLMGYVLSDVAGLFRQETLMEVSKLVLEGSIDEAIDFLVSKIFGKEQEEDSEEKEEESDEQDAVKRGNIDKSIGYDAHLGGALGGVMFDYFCIKNNKRVFSPRKLLKYMCWTKKELFGAFMIWVASMVIIETFM